MYTTIIQHCSHKSKLFEKILYIWLQICYIILVAKNSYKNNVEEGDILEKKQNREVDQKELRIAMIRADVTMAQLIAGLELSPPGFYRKLNGKSHFTTKEIRIISKILSLTVEDRDKIFLLYL
nr:MAG TPA: repressor protein C2 [Caudoviricetes sp.]